MELAERESEGGVLLKEGCRVYGVWSRLEEGTARGWEGGAGGFCEMTLLADRTGLWTGFMKDDSCGVCLAK